MNSCHLHAALCASMVLAAPLALAQRTSWRDDPEFVARVRAHSKSVQEADEFVKSAREEMHNRRFDRVIVLCDRAIQDLMELGGKEYTTQAHEVLAEAALLRGNFGQALREAEACEPRILTQRFGMTKALALIGLGRRKEARAMILAEAGTATAPTQFRNANQLPELPLDKDTSDKALAASAYLIRASWFSWAGEYPEVTDDAKAAVALAPGSAMARYWYGIMLARTHVYDAARTELEKAAALGSPAIADKARLGIAGINRILWEKNKGNG